MGITHNYLLYLLNGTMYIQHQVAQSVFPSTNVHNMYWK